jgi:CheY-like chemotaxis protein
MQSRDMAHERRMVLTAEPQPRRVLVVDDEALIAMLVEDMLTELGYAPVGPVGQLDEALEQARQGGFDAAILDVNLNGEAVFPVAHALTERRLPFAFASGHAAAELQEAFPDTPVLLKPFNIAQVGAVLAQIFARAPAGR